MTPSPNTSASTEPPQPLPNVETLTVLVLEVLERDFDAAAEEGRAVGISTLAKHVAERLLLEPSTLDLGAYFTDSGCESAAPGAPPQSQPSQRLALERLVWAAEQVLGAREIEARADQAAARIRREDDPELYDQRAEAYAAAAVYASQADSGLRHSLVDARLALAELPQDGSTP